MNFAKRHIVYIVRSIYMTFWNSKVGKPISHCQGLDYTGVDYQGIAQGNLGDERTVPFDTMVVDIYLYALVKTHRAVHHKE